MFFPSLNQHIIICVYWFKLISQVSDVAHGPLVLILCPTALERVSDCSIKIQTFKEKLCTFNDCSCLSVVDFDLWGSNGISGCKDGIL